MCVCVSSAEPSGSIRIRGAVLAQHGEADGHRGVQAVLVAGAHGAAPLLLDDHLVEVSEPRSFHQQTLGVGMSQN